jgi:16S rRNA (guanine966-N2)-methyltransferase
VSRIISGSAGSIKLKPAAKSTRPTSDRVKESLFAKLESMDALDSARVLDLYAGTGALGLEAASRGASEVILVEKDKIAAEVIRENIRQVAKALQVGVLVTLQQQDVARFLQKIASEYDLVFIDPPYEVNNSELIGQLSALTKHLADGALVCIERSSRSERLTPDFGFSQLETKTYGDTAVSFWQFAR